MPRLSPTTAVQISPSAASGLLMTTAAGIGIGLSKTNTDVPALNLNNHGFSEGQMAWNALGYHDVTRGLIHIMGKGTSSTDATWHHTYYDIAANAWSAQNNLAVSDNFGHVYANFTMDPTTGDLYAVLEQQIVGQQVWKYSAGPRTWARQSAILFTGPTSTPCNGVGFHPNLFGAGVGGVCVALRTDGADNMGYALYNPVTNQRSQVPTTTINNGGDTAQMVYFPAINKMIQGRARGNDAFISAGNALPPAAPLTPVSVVPVGLPLFPCGGPADTTAAPQTNMGVRFCHPFSNGAGAGFNPMLSASKMVVLGRTNSSGAPPDSRAYTTVDGVNYVPVVNHPMTCTVGSIMIPLGGGADCVLQLGTLGNGTNVKQWRLYKIAA